MGHYLEGSSAEIKGKLLLDRELSAWNISINTTEGRVTLSGKIASPELAGKVVLLTHKTKGVREVFSTLIVEQGKSEDGPSKQ